jgi:hypothetical protein
MTGDQPSAIAVPAGDHPESVVLDFMQPFGTSRRGRRARGEANFQGQHAGM